MALIKQALTPKLVKLAHILEWVRIEEFVSTNRGGIRGDIFAMPVKADRAACAVHAQADGHTAGWASI